MILQNSYLLLSLCFARLQEWAFQKKFWGFYISYAIYSDDAMDQKQATSLSYCPLLDLRRNATCKSLDYQVVSSLVFVALVVVRNKLA